jgi:bacterioferritin
MASFIKDIEEIRQRAIDKIEDGPVTAAYKGDKDKSVEILNEALATEIVCVLRYMHHYFMATGVHGRAVADEFKEHADEEREHADMIAERIQQLGGKPDFNPASLLQRSVAQYVEGETLADMIREDLIAERTVIEVYQEMIRFFGDNDPTTRRMIEHILAQEEEHAADLSDFLYIVDPETGKTEGQDPGTDPLSINERGRQAGRTSNPQRGLQNIESDEYPNDAEEYTEVNANANQQSRGNRRPNPARDVPGRNREYDGTQQAPVEVTGRERNQNRGQRGSANSVGITNQDRVVRRDPARTPPSGSLHGGTEKRPASEPFAGRGSVRGESNVGGVEGRPMNRRRDIEDDDTAPRQPAARADRGGMTGGTRSPKIVQKNRKNNKRIA